MKTDKQQNSNVNRELSIVELLAQRRRILKQMGPNPRFQIATPAPKINTDRVFAQFHY